jgi:hypothetical protein
VQAISVEETIAKMPHGKSISRCLTPERLIDELVRQCKRWLDVGRAADGGSRARISERSDDARIPRFAQ